MDLQACLDQCSLGQLRQIANANDVSFVEPAARGELVQALAKQLSDPGYLQLHVSQLAEDERCALEFVASEGGQVRGFLLERQLRHSSNRQVLGEAGHDTVAELLHKGLLYRALQAAGPERGEVYVVPDELLPLFPSRPAQADSVPGPVERPRETRRCSSSFTIFALASFVRRWREREARSPQPEGQLGALNRETAELAVELPGRLPRERWTLLAHLSLELGLFARQERGLQPTEQLEDWLALGQAGERQLWSRYVAAAQWNDLERAGSGGGRFVGRTADPLTARAHLLQVIGGLPDNDWLLASEVERLVRDRVPDFLREGFEDSTSRVVDLQSGEVLGGPGSWERVEAPLVAYLLRGPLFWLGVVEWGLGPADWDRLRVTPTGRLWLEDSDEVLRPTPAPLKLTDGRRVIASERCDLALLWELEPYLALERRGPPSEYQLSRASLARGLEAGGSVGQLRRLLERAAGGPPPLSFGLALSRWASRAGRFRLKPMVVLSAEEPEELTALLERVELSELIAERLGPTVAAVPPTRAGDLADALERSGELPEMDAALRLMAGRRAYPALVDQGSLQALLFCILLVKALKPDLLDEIPNAARLTPRLEHALGSIAARRLGRRARSLARQLRQEMGPKSRPEVRAR